MFVCCHVCAMLVAVRWWSNLKAKESAEAEEAGSAKAAQAAAPDDQEQELLNLAAAWDAVQDAVLI